MQAVKHCVDLFFPTMQHGYSSFTCNQFQKGRKRKWLVGLEHAILHLDHDALKNALPIELSYYNYFPFLMSHDLVLGMSHGWR